MKRVLASSLVLTAALLSLAPACDDTRPIAAIRDGTAECEAIGNACHDPGVRFGGRYEECHDIGHEGEGKPCLAAYEECFALCKAAPGEGGAGGESHGSSGAGGSDAGEAGTGGSHAGEAGAGGSHAGEAGAGGAE